MATFPKEHDKLYFDALIRTQKGESLLSMIQATYHAKKSAKKGDDVKAMIAKRLKDSYALFRDNVRGYDDGVGSYTGTEDQFASQYTLGHEMAIWLNSNLDLNPLAIQVAENKITVRDYLDVVLLNYVQPVNGVCVHPLYQMLKYLDTNDKKTLTKEEMKEALEINSVPESINALYNILIASNYFESTNVGLLYVGKLSVSDLILLCNTKYIGTEGYNLAKSELLDDDNYNEYITSSREVDLYITEDDSVLDFNVYGIHIKELNNALSDDDPHICIGWSNMGDLSAITSKEELGRKYDETWPDSKPKAKGQNIGQIWRFIKEMQIGDYVVFADGDKCHIGKIISDYYFDNDTYVDQSADYANTRKVEWLKKNILRSELSESFHRSLMTAMSVWGLNDYKSAIYQLLNGTYKKDEVVFEDIEEEDIFSGFEEWLTSYNNPDYTGKEKYNWYPSALKRLVDFMREQGLIEDSNLDDRNIDKYYSWLEIYNSSEIVKEYDEKKLSSKAGGAALKKYIKYIKYLNSPHAEVFDYASTKGTATNKIFFGTPGCGKSYYIEHSILEKDNDTKEYVGAYSKERVIRTTFYQDYSNTDFVGQILPKVVRGENGEKDVVEYIFNPGPFTLALIQAISNPTKKVALVIEEINRGNAPAIFGDIFQLLDRNENGISEYGIVNVGLMDYLNAYEFKVDTGNAECSYIDSQNAFMFKFGIEKKRYHFDEIRIPGNMDIFATMNTSDQNVYTLDTAFVRRWDKVKIKNSFKDCKFKDVSVPGMEEYTWEEFVTSINAWIAKHLEDLQVNEDKQIGAFFVKESLLVEKDPVKFAYKVFDYLWSDVSKLDHGVFFNSYETLDSLIDAYKSSGVGVFKTGIFDVKKVVNTEEEDDE